MANLSGIITPTNVLTATSTNTVTNKTINIANNTLTGVQPTLVSGTSIKTVNGSSLLGSGNVAIASGGMTLLATLTPANGVTSVTATGLSSSKQMIVVGDQGLTLTQTGALRIKLSVDNGATFPGNQFVFTSNSTTPGQALANIYNTAINGQKRIATFIQGVAGFEIEANTTINSGTINAINILTNSDAAFTGGSNIYIYGIN